MHTLAIKGNNSGRRRALRPSWAGLLVLAAAAWVPVNAATLAPEFATPDAAVAALVAAVRTHRTMQLRSILGPGSGKLLRSGDPTEDAISQHRFVVAYDTAHSIVYPENAAGTAELLIGPAAWPLPIPLVQAKNGRWHFNTARGAAEILARRIGRNELSAMQVCLAIIDAEYAYAQRHSSPDGLGEYTARIRSSPGKHVPYQGYYYKILTAQGASAPGGAYDYAVQGRLVGGIAVMAYPARYGASGVMSFMVDQNRIVYESNLGRATATAVQGLKAFNPDAGWREVQPHPDSAHDGLPGPGS